jgi:hypothetical protein
LGVAFTQILPSIVIDNDAAGWGWHVDTSTPPASGRVDLLSTVLHELGHIIGLDHDDHADSPMAAALGSGTRHLPAAFSPLAAPLTGGAFSVGSGQPTLAPSLSAVSATDRVFMQLGQPLNQRFGSDSRNLQAEPAALQLQRPLTATADSLAADHLLSNVADLLHNRRHWSDMLHDEPFERLVQSLDESLLEKLAAGESGADGLRASSVWLARAEREENTSPVRRNQEAAESRVPDRSASNAPVDRARDDSVTVPDDPRDGHKAADVANAATANSNEQPASAATDDSDAA